MGLPPSNEWLEDEQQPKREASLAAPTLLAAVKAWRTAEVHHAAVMLDLRDGDEQLAKTKLDDRTRELRIAADEYLKAANARLNCAGEDPK